jgi:hypothetical protein
MPTAASDSVVAEPRLFWWTLGVAHAMRRDKGHLVVVALDIASSQPLRLAAGSSEPAALEAAFGSGALRHARSVADRVADALMWRAAQGPFWRGNLDDIPAAGAPELAEAAGEAGLRAMRHRFRKGLDRGWRHSTDLRAFALCFHRLPDTAPNFSVLAAEPDRPHLALPEHEAFAADFGAAHALRLMRDVAERVAGPESVLLSRSVPFSEMAALLAPCEAALERARIAAALPASDPKTANPFSPAAPRPPRAL